MAIKSIDRNTKHIEGFSIRAGGAAILILSYDEITAMFEMQTNTMVVKNNVTDTSALKALTNGWGTEIEYIDHEDFQALVYNNFRVIV